jgi:tetratricopeptide (TPR) repeat protein
MNPGAIIQSAMAALAAGHAESAESLYQSLVNTRPTLSDAHMLGGMVAVRSGRPGDAIPRFAAALAIDSRNAAAHNWLSALLLEDGKPVEALDHAQAALRLRPDDPHILFNLGLCLLELEDAAKAVTVFERAVVRRPGQAAYHSRLALAYEALGRDFDAVRELRESLRIAPELPEFLRLGDQFVKLGRASDAVETYRQALEIDPNSTRAHLAMSRAMADLLRNEDAMFHLERAEAIDPQLGEASLRRAHLMQMRGTFVDAEPHFLRAIELEPGLGVAYHGLVSAKRVTADDAPLLERIRVALRLGGLSVSNESHLHYALGKAFDDLGDYGPAMDEFDAANRIVWNARVRKRSLNHEALASEIDARMRIFTPEFFSSMPSASESEQPIFIVGLPRSGTTLVEQVLSCHPDVAAAGELSYWAHAEAKLVDFAGGRVDRAGLTGSVAPYQELVAGFASGKTHVTDKNPANCLSLGVIHAALPNARIIHVRRNPLDTALSIYMTPWATPPNFACDKDNIVFFSAQYARLMSHWRAVLPQDRFLEIEYEDLVANGEAVVRRLLAFCGVAWSDACLHPENNDRTVRTPSFWQVRQPLYTTSINRGQRYRPYLGAFERLV